jgi:hypothetical protein
MKKNIEHKISRIPIINPSRSRPFVNQLIVYKLEYLVCKYCKQELDETIFGIDYNPRSTNFIMRRAINSI